MADPLSAPRRFYRCRLFWLGLLVLVFYLWAWADSRWFRSWVSWEAPGRSLVFVYTDSCVGFSAMKAPFLRASPAGEFGWGRNTAEDNPFYDPAKATLPPIFPAAFGHSVWTLDNGKEREETWEVAWWVIVGAHTTAWIGLLIFWQRRKELLKTITLPP